MIGTSHFVNLWTAGSEDFILELRIVITSNTCNTKTKIVKIDKTVAALIQTLAEFPET